MIGMTREQHNGQIVRHRTLLQLAILMAAVLGTPLVAMGQGLLVDIHPDHHFRLPRPIIHPPHPPRPPVPPPSSYRIKQLELNATLSDQVARVQVSQTFVNTGPRTMEVCFLFPIPYDSAIDHLTLLVDGKEFDGKLLSREEARRIYEGYIRRNRDPALLEWMGSGMFKTSVFPVPPGAERTVTLRYSQVCRRMGGLTELLLPLSTAKYTSKPVEKMIIRVSLKSDVPIKNIYSPSHALEIKRAGPRQATVQSIQHNVIPGSDFRLMYDVGDEAVTASLVSYRPIENKDGYFILLVSPEIQSKVDRSIRKNVVFVVDRSGSMSGKKIEQAKGALRFVLNNLNKGDLFNIVAYDTEIESFQPEMQRYGDSTRKQALGFVEGIHAGGSTNIDGALTVALDMLKDDQDPSYVIFLTDGLPTAGQTNPNAIVANATKHNAVRARIFNFGVGYDVNSRLLDKLARECFGQSQYVRPDEDIEEQVSRLYQRIGAPAMTDIAIHYDIDGLAVEKGAVTNRVYPKDAYDLFAGDQLVLVGRYKHSGAVKLTVAGRVGGEKEKFHFKGTLVKHSADSSRGYVERLWAMRRIGEIIDKIDLEGRNEELVDELIALSKRHGILTPYTSFLADDTGGPVEEARFRVLTNEALDQLSSAPGGRSGVVQRAAKAALQRGSAAGFSSGAARVLDLATEREVTLQNVQNVRTKTFFKRNGIWEDSIITEKQKKELIEIKRYSDEYFRLARDLGTDASRYLALEGNLMVVLKGQAYQVKD
jgi:Ca-activated chloride channel family protein